jgi:hypothetical protein
MLAGMNSTSPVRLVAALGALVAVASLSACSILPASSGGSGGGQPAGGSTSTSGSGGSGSGGSSKPAKAGIDLSALDPCALFPKAEAEKLVGTTLSAGESVKDPTQPNCTYNPDPNGTTAQATLNVGAGAENFYNIDHNGGHEFTDVPGLGDEGHLERQAIFWRTGSTWAEINMLRLVDDDHQFDQPLIDAAKAVQAQLGT